MLVIREVEGLNDIDYRRPILRSLVGFGFRYVSKAGGVKRFSWLDNEDTKVLILDTVHCIESYFTLVEFKARTYSGSDFGRYIIPKNLDFIAKYADDFSIFMLFLSHIYDGDWCTVNGSYIVFDNCAFLFHCSHEELVGKFAKFRMLVL